MRRHRPRLAESPASAECLIDLLKTVVETDENHVGAVLPVQSEPGDGRFSDQDADFAARELAELLFFYFFLVSPGQFFSMLILNSY